jgi:hypothetical protein
MPVLVPLVAQARQIELELELEGALLACGE